MDKPKKKEPARLVVELSSREKLKVLHQFGKKLGYPSTAQWARAVLFREVGL